MPAFKTDILSVFRKPSNVKYYAQLTGLQIAEQVIFRRFQSELGGKKILDIGVGAGRTVPFLLALGEGYVGIDIAPEMVDHCRRKFPTGNFAVCSAMDLSRFADSEFDMALFSFNGLDYPDHNGRLQALGEIHRILAPGGLFVFSSHNRACRPAAPPWEIRSMNLDPVRRPRHTLRTLAGLLPASVNHLRMKPFESEHENYSLRNDSAHFYSLLIYYISIPDQIRQLEYSGFGSIEPVALDGRWLRPGEWAETVDDPWIYYVCRKSIKSELI
ncbi:class I SAM-dependent methyltransferase [Rhodoblastus sp.]|uniref:class I SAM-dependent methyltransferase n=1 Tax=Rhodoblastus sp. TaxID=1962975 RepID=UPI003F9A0EE6